MCTLIPWHPHLPCVLSKPFTRSDYPSFLRLLVHLFCCLPARPCCLPARAPLCLSACQTTRSAVSEEEDEDDDKGGAVETFSELTKELTAPIQVREILTAAMAACH